MVWEGGKGCRLFPLPRLPLLFPPMRNLVSSYSLPFPPSIPVIFFCFVALISRTSQRTHPETLATQQRNWWSGQICIIIKKNKKHENGARHCIFNLVHLIAHQTLEPFFIKTFCCRRLLSYHFVMVLLSSHYLSRPVCLCWGFWTDSSIPEVYSDLVELVMAHKYWPSRSLAPPIPQGSMGIL